MDVFLAQSASVSLTLHFLQDSLYVGRRRLLPLRELFESLKELSHDYLCRNMTQSCRHTSACTS
jgi:hypothetical protein